MTRAARVLVATASYIAAILGVAASAFACVHLLFPLARAVNCFHPRESTWIHALESVGWSVAGMFGILLAMVLGNRASATPGVREFILWWETALGVLLIVPIVFVSSVMSESGVASRTGCGLSMVGSAAIAGLLLVPVVVASLPALLSLSKRPAAVAYLVAVAATIMIWAAVFLAIRPWDYPGR